MKLLASPTFIVSNKIYALNIYDQDFTEILMGRIISD